MHAWLCFLLIITECLANSAIVFNTTALCVQDGLCNFVDNSTWCGNTSPSLNDDVLIDNPTNVTVAISSSVAINSISISGYVTLLINNDAAFKVAENFTWTASSLVIVQSGTCRATVVNGTSLYLNGSTRFAVNELSVQSATVVDSHIVTNDIFVAYMVITDSHIDSYYGPTFVSLQCYGDTTFFSFSSGIYVYSYALFEGNSNLMLYGITTMNQYAMVIFNNSSINIGDLRTIGYSSVSIVNCYDSSIQSIQSPSSKLQLDNTSIAIKGASGFSLQLGNIVHINLPFSSHPVSFTSVTQQPDSQVFINCSNSLSFTQSTVLRADLYLSTAGVLTITNMLTILPVTPGICISGNGKVYLNSFFRCAGAMIVNNLVLRSSLAVELLTVTNLHVDNYYYVAQVTGDLVIARGGSISFDGNYMFLSGNYEQDDGTIQVNFDVLPVVPILRVNGSVSISKVDVFVDIEEGLKEKLLFAEAAEEIKAKFSSATDQHDTDHKIMARVRENQIFIETAELGDLEWIQYHYIYFPVCFGVMVILMILVIKLLRRAMTTITFKDAPSSVSHFWHAVKVGRLEGWGDRIHLAIWFIFLFPVIVETTCLTIALAVLIPLGFLFGLVEHKFMLIWGILVSLIQLGGLLDLFADIMLLAKFSLYFLTKQLDPKKAGDLDYLDGPELQLWLARMAFTCIGALLALIIFFTLINKNGLGRLLDKMTGEQYFAGSKELNLKLPNATGLLMLAVIMILTWKVVLITLRTYLLAIVIASLVKTGRLQEEVQRKVQWLELILYFDLVWSGIPLGVLTLLEMFWFSESIELGIEQIFELTKLSALSVDIVGASFLIWYSMAGLIKKVPVLHHHHHHEHHNDDENQSLLSKANIQKEHTDVVVHQGK